MREAGGKAWDNIEDPEEFLGRKHHIYIHEALQLAREGKRVRCLGWKTRSYLFAEGGQFIRRVLFESGTIVDERLPAFFAADCEGEWEVLPS